LADPDEIAMDIAAAAPPAPGGALRVYTEYAAAAGEAAVLSPDGTHVWAGGVRGELMRIPLECTDAPAPGLVRSLLGRHGVWMVTYLVTPDDARPANCLDYVCRDPDYRLGKLASPARRDIRRGLRSFTVRLCTWDELIEKGHPAEVDTAERHGYVRPSAEGLRAFAERRRGFPLFEIWGAWEGDRLAAWMSVCKVDDWAMIDVCRSRTASLRNCPNNALLFTATRRFLAEEKRRWVTYGLSSLQVAVNELAMHKYKVRMGYEALPMRRVFALHWTLGLLMRSRAASVGWEMLAKWLPKQAALRKAAGLARLVSGRERSPLAWAKADES